MDSELLGQLYQTLAYHPESSNSRIRFKSGSIIILASYQPHASIFKRSCLIGLSCCSHMNITPVSPKQSPWEEGLRNPDYFVQGICFTSTSWTKQFHCISNVYTIPEAMCYRKVPYTVYTCGHSNPNAYGEIIECNNTRCRLSPAHVPQRGSCGPDCAQKCMGARTIQTFVSQASTEPCPRCIED
ncbi:hypothetical protein PNOK_0641600 [Pyrrhoderma noxium]|uniref:Uncharacterized protein n=1 Tax=Pyrrhoderma noxium TaxID=2282107 RepID=A0A286UEB2_9AGAM|nr:hypothetical protein PNOK_0641600 [Pyrrhoderma noxium]